MKLDKDKLGSEGGSEISDAPHKFRVSIVDVQGMILREIADKRMKRDDVATTYAFCIKQRDECDFAVINAAILARWSRSGLIYIKERAWKIVHGTVKP